MLITLLLRFVIIGIASELNCVEISPEWNKYAVFNSIFTLINSTSGIHNVSFRTYGPSVARTDINSFLFTTNCIIDIMNKQTISPFICEGHISLERLTVQSGYIVRNLFDSPSITDVPSDRTASVIDVRASHFRDILYDSEGGFISGVAIRRELINECLFVNISAGLDKIIWKQRRGRREECVLRDSWIIGAENGIYGGIVSGIKEENEEVYSFICHNNTISHSYRSDLLNPVRTNEDYKDTNFTTRIVFNSSSSHTFTNCTFTSCASPTHGGAICFFFSSSSSSSHFSTIHITHCTFTNCSVDQIGHSVYCRYASSCVVSGCSFVNSKIGSNGGGGVYLLNITSCVAVKDSSFTLFFIRWRWNIPSV